MPGKTTIKDVARQARTSITAVSLTLNKRPNRLSDATRRRIVETAERLHYVPNQNARSLVSSRSMLLGLIVPDIQNVFFADMAKYLSDECNAQGYVLVIANSNDDAAGEQRLIRQFRSRGLDGMMIVPSLESFGRPDEFRTAIEHCDIPVVLLDRISSLPWCDSVGFDNYLGGRMAAQFLLDHGHRQVAMIAAKSTYMSRDGRTEGFLNRMAEAGFPVPPERITEGRFRFEGGLEAIDPLLEQHVTAVFCGNDMTALGVMSGMAHRGVRIPDDISVIGYDNDMFLRGINVELTTIDQNLRELTGMAMRTILQRIEQGPMAGQGPKTSGEDMHTDGRRGRRAKRASAESAPRTDATPGTRPRTGRPWLERPRKTLLSPQLVERTTVTRIPTTQGE
ncbi:MAG: LacI family DNA-binding transcriptional regulator [Bifidobacterium sp.]|jgi:LacI family transcriptional regulator